jgi:putative peptide zinc metalloprotease protein
METLDVYAPFDCVIDSDTSVLNGKSVAYQDVLLSIRSVPSALVIVSVPENERAYLSVGDSTEIRLYSKIEKVLYGRVQKISPVTTESNDQDIVQVYIKLADDLPANFIGAVGVAKIRTGWTCLLWTSLKPIARFIHVDIWSYLP